MEPLFERVFLKIQKPKNKKDDVFAEIEELFPISEAMLVDFAQDCADIVHTLRDKKVRWNGKFVDVMEETDEYKILIVEQKNLTAIV